MTKLSKFESDLIKLQWVWVRLSTVYNEFPKIQGSNQNTKTFRKVVNEMIILQLYNFLKIRNELREEKPFKKFDDCLSPLWEPIDKIEATIREIRHNYIAHVQEEEFVKKPFEYMIPEIFDKYQTPTSIGYWVMLAGCVTFYGEMIAANFKKEADAAGRKYAALSPVNTKYGNVTISTYKKHLKPILEKTKETLLTNGYKITK